MSDTMGKVYTMLGAGTGAFTQGASVSVISARGVLPGTVLVGDFNHDGRHDVAVVNEFTDTQHSFAVALARPTGGFNAPSFYDGGINPSTGAVADLNNDGHLDLVASDTTGSQQVVQLGNGNGWLDIASVGSQVASFPTVAELTVLLNTTS